MVIKILVLLPIFFYLILDYLGPKRIIIRPSNRFNLLFIRAQELIVQEFDKEGNLWAVRGLILYKLKPGDDKFIKSAHVPTGFSYFWLNNFSLFRRFMNKPECLEVTITGDGHIVALSAGYMWHSYGKRVQFKKTMKLPHYGVGIGRGILSNGLLTVKDSQVFFGEYYRNADRTYVRVYKSNNNGQTWEIASEFNPGEIRHIHALLEDPFTGRLWICSGDADSESMIGWSDDGFKSITKIGKGSQMWRSCQLVFTEDSVYWGTDTGSEDLAGIYKWDKVTMKTTKLFNSHGAILYGTRLLKGTIVFSTDREGFPNEKDKKTRLFVINNDGKITEVEFGTWKHYRKGYRYSFAMLRIQRSQRNKALAVSIINQKEFPSGELLLITEENLINNIKESVQ